MSSPVPRLVLDTNVALDLFVFRDGGCADLMDALRSGQVQAVVDEACRREWLAVLDYPDLHLGDELKLSAGAAFDQHISLLAPAMLAPPTGVRLPRCADPDDQKFLELALAAEARWLISKDKALLALARRTAREGWFDILIPSHWRLPETASGDSR